MKAPIAIGLSLLALVAVAGVSSDRLGGAEEAVASAKAPKTNKAPGAGKTEVVPPEDRIQVPPPKRAELSKGPSLRCWQYGRLIFDEPVSDVPATLAGTGHRFAGRSGTVQLLDMHNSSCLIK